MKNILIAAALCVPALTMAGTLADPVSAFALPAGANYDGNDWNALNKIRRVHWEGRAGQPTPDSSFMRMGNMPLEPLGGGDASILFTGVRTIMTQLTVVWGGNGSGSVKPEMFDKLMAVEFVKGTRFEVVRDLCAGKKDAGSVVYKVTMPTKNPLYARVSTDRGNGAPESVTTTFMFMQIPDDSWRGCDM